MTNKLAALWGIYAFVKKKKKRHLRELYWHRKQNITLSNLNLKNIFKKKKKSECVIKQELRKKRCEIFTQLMSFRAPKTQYYQNWGFSLPLSLSLSFSPDTNIHRNTLPSPLTRFHGDSSELFLSTRIRVSVLITIHMHAHAYSAK